MAARASSNTVFIRRCEDYDRGGIAAIVTKGMQLFGYRPRGRIVVKPNVVFAYAPEVFGNTAIPPRP